MPLAQKFTFRGRLARRNVKYSELVKMSKVELVQWTVPTAAVGVPTVTVGLLVRSTISGSPCMYRYVFNTNVCIQISIQTQYYVLNLYPVYLLLTEPAAVGAWFWRWRSRPMWSVAQDTLQSASDWTSGPGLFRHHQHKLGQTGVGVGEPVLRRLRRDDPSQLCDQVSKGPSQ